MQHNWRQSALCITEQTADLFVEHRGIAHIVQQKRDNSHHRQDQRTDHQGADQHHHQPAGALATDNFLKIRRQAVDQFINDKTSEKAPQQLKRQDH